MDLNDTSPLFYCHTVLSVQNILILHPLQNKSKDFFFFGGVNNIPFTSINYFSSCLLGYYFLETSMIFSQFESTDAYLLYKMKSFMQL